MNITTPNHSTQMMQAVYRAYGFHAINIEQLIYAIAERQCLDYPEISLWEFHAEPASGLIGYWVPMINKETISVSCPNYYQNEQMDRKSFGAAITYMAINHLIWILDEKAPGSSQVKAMIGKQDALYALMYADQTTLDTSAMFSFLD